jgi:hypothetical protein
MSSKRPFRAGTKYGAKRVDGYASKRERDYAAHLATLKQAGKILDWIEQVPVKLPGGIKYVIDFMTIASDGVRFIEVKGMETDVWKIKMKLLSEAHPEIYARLDVVK